jgi:hypothetical protein
MDFGELDGQATFEVLATSCEKIKWRNYQT